MIILSLKRKRQNVEIVFDDGATIFIDYRVVADAGLRKNDIVDEKNIDLLLARTEVFAVKDSAFRLLARRLHSSKELKEKLERRGFSKPVINDVVIHLQQNEFLNDLEYAKLYAQEKLEKKKYGILKIKAELFRKGIERKIIENVIGDLDESSIDENISLLISKKLKSVLRKETDKKKIKQKIFSYLASRGYQTDIIIKSINKLNLD